MSRAENKADVQVTHPGHIFPFGGSSSSPLPNLAQCFRFNLPERFPLRPFRQDLLPRLPLPPSIMASSKTVMPTGAGAFPGVRGHYSDDPFKKIVQLEKNIVFIQDGHIKMLKALHEEISDLKDKNRELQFQLIMNCSAQSTELPSNDGEVVSCDKVEKLEKEVKKLRLALREALKNNTTLTNELQILKREQASLSSTATGSTKVKTPKDHGSNSRGGHHHAPPSPEMLDYSDTLKQIQYATSSRNSRSSEAHSSNYYWNKGGSGYVENRRGYHYNNRHHMQRSQDGRHHQQPRLPRLPLKNQIQNYLPNRQYEIQYQHRTSNILPSLKPSEQGKQHKSRASSHQPKVADHLYNQ